MKHLNVFRLVIPARHHNNVIGLNFCIRKSALLELEGFHPDNIPAHLQIYQGDGETGLTMKAQNLNYKAVYHPKICLCHLISLERLSIEYFKKRAFYQGVCNSFTNLKIEHYGKVEKGKTFSESIKRLGRGLANKCKFLLCTPKEIKAIKSILRAKEKEGYNYHQQTFKNNDKVRDWVLRKNYWDYKLPG